MRLEATEHADLDVYKVWLNDTEFEELRRSAANHRDDGAYVGLRAFDLTRIKLNHLKRTTTSEIQFNFQSPWLDF